MRTAARGGRRDAHVPGPQPRAVRVRISGTNLRHHRHQQENHLLGRYVPEEGKAREGMLCIKARESWGGCGCTCIQSKAREGVCVRINKVRLESVYISIRQG